METSWLVAATRCAAGRTFWVMYLWSHSNSPGILLRLPRLRGRRISLLRNSPRALVASEQGGSRVGATGASFACRISAVCSEEEPMLCRPPWRETTAPPTSGPKSLSRDDHSTCVQARRYASARARHPARVGGGRSKTRALHSRKLGQKQ